ncbi:MAG TPA: LysR family transcriptional regulator [Cyclobacteriaceae bacterium]|nr:LysR family transcriptional regulator [Cyclobacteriaceae bacterium]
MNYTLNQLNIFLRVTKTLSITKAATELNLTQPAVSIQLRNFQDQFDTPLIEVVGKKIYVTEFGKEITQLAENIMDQVAKINFKTHSQKGQLTGRLRLSIVSTGQYVMPFFLPSFMKQHKNAELVMDVTNRSRVIESLEQNTVDFSLVSILPRTPVVEKLDLMENKFFLVGNTEEKFKKTPYSKQILKELPLILREKGSGTRTVMENFIERSHLAVIQKMELTSNEAVKQAVMAGLGYSIMPLIAIESELQNGRLQIIPVNGLPIKNTWRLIWLKGKKHSPVAQVFLDYMRKEKNTVIKKYFSF